MNKLFQLFIVLSFITCEAYADQFHLKEPEAAGGYDVSYAKVSITGDRAFTGRTDKFGRITINGLPNGAYTAKVLDSRGQEKSASLNIDGQGNLKDVYVQW
jgi:hypothetical protein